MNKRKIEINGNTYEVWGSNPWHLVNIPNGTILVETEVIDAPDFLTNPQRYNALRRVTPTGAAMNVLFTGDSGRAMAEEIAFIINQKL
jgi:hypothetical protein